MRPVQPRTVLVRDGLGLSSTDVVLNLFLFFVIAFALIATFRKEQKKQDQPSPTAQSERLKVIDLPRSSSALGDAAAGSVVVESDASGAVFVDGASVPRAELTQVLLQRLGDTRRPVVLRAAKGLALGDAVELFDLINAAGPQSVSLSTLEKAASPQR